MENPEKEPLCTVKELLVFAVICAVYSSILFSMDPEKSVLSAQDGFPVAGTGQVKEGRDVGRAMSLTGLAAEVTAAAPPSLPKSPWNFRDCANRTSPTSARPGGRNAG